jgi:hypothetical protein
VGVDRGRRDIVAEPLEIPDVRGRAVASPSELTTKREAVRMSMSAVRAGQLFELAGSAVGAARTARYAELKVGWAGFVFFTGLPAGEAYESALAAARERGDAASEVGALVGRGRVAVRDGRWDDLRAAALVALDVAKATGDRA